MQKVHTKSKHVRTYLLKDSPSNPVVDSNSRFLREKIKAKYPLFVTYAPIRATDAAIIKIKFVKYFHSV